MMQWATARGKQNQRHLIRMLIRSGAYTHSDHTDALTHIFIDILPAHTEINSAYKVAIPSSPIENVHDHSASSNQSFDQYHNFRNTKEVNDIIARMTS